MCKFHKEIYKIVYSVKKYVKSIKSMKQECKSVTELEINIFRNNQVEGIETMY